MSANFNETNIKTLLEKWNLMELYKYFCDEGIDLEVLAMMKSHHVAELLRHFKFGTRVRFEHNFELWRRTTNNPLRLEAINCVQNFLTTPVAAATTTLNTNNNPPLLLPLQTAQRERVAETTKNQHNSVSALTDAASAPITAAESISQTASNAVPAVSSCTVAAFPAVLKNAKSSRITGDWIHNKKLELDAISLTLPTAISILDIINASGKRGAEIMEDYHKHNQIAQDQRFMLINMIASYFHEHDLHLSLKVSHQLEQQILKLFPTEKLSYYRTETRGKIYAKYCNGKRYKKTMACKRMLERNDAADETNNSSIDDDEDYEQQSAIEDANMRNVSIDANEVYSMDTESLCNKTIEIKTEKITKDELNAWL